MNIARMNMIANKISNTPGIATEDNIVAVGGVRGGKINVLGAADSKTHKNFSNKRDAMKFLNDHALMSVGWPEGQGWQEACYWNGKVHITKADRDQEGRPLSSSIQASRPVDSKGDLVRPIGEYALQSKLHPNEWWGGGSTIANSRLVDEDEAGWLKGSQILGLCLDFPSFADRWNIVRED